jgi:hypothetical protein
VQPSRQVGLTSTKLHKHSAACLLQQPSCAHVACAGEGKALHEWQQGLSTTTKSACSAQGRMTATLKGITAWHVSRHASGCMPEAFVQGGPAFFVCGGGWTVPSGFFYPTARHSPRFSKVTEARSPSLTEELHYEHNALSHNTLPPPHL